MKHDRNLIKIDNSLHSLVYRADILLKGKLQEALHDVDITAGQWSLLKALYEKDGLNQKDLSEENFKEQAAMTRSLDILERKGLIERRISPNDRREYLVFITKNGRQLFESTLPKLGFYRETLNSLFSDEELTRLKFLLNKLCEGLVSSSGKNDA